MNTTPIEDQNQSISSEKLGIFSTYFAKLKVGSLLNRSGIVKTKGASPLEIFTIIFNLSFVSKNFYEGVVRNKQIEIGKDAVYNFLNSPIYNWRRFTLILFSKIYLLIKRLLDDDSPEEVLIFDDSTYNRSRSKKVELLAKVKRALETGVKAKYLLMDSWFSMPIVVATLRKHIHVICMMKDQQNWLYEYQGKKLRLSDLYSKLTKKRGKAKIKAEVIVKASNEKKIKIIFVPGDKKRGWLALLSTDLDLPGEEIVRLYGKRWDIEVFFKMCKQHLKLVKEIQIRNYDGLIGHTSLVIARYNLLSLFQRERVDQRSFGDLFRACHDEMTNISFLTALQRIMILVRALLQEAHNISDEIIQTILDQVMGMAINYWGLGETLPALAIER